MKNLLFMPLLALSFTFINPCSPNSRFIKKEPKPTDKIFAVEVTTPTSHDVPRIHITDGVFEPVELATVTAAGSGAVEQILVSVGDKVSPDDPLITISSKELSDLAELKRLRARELEVRLARAKESFRGMAVPDRPVTQAEVDFLDDEPMDESASQREQEMPEQKPEDPVTLRNLVSLIEVMLERLNREIQMLDGRLASLNQTSPVGGVVTKIATAEKNHVHEGDPLVDVARLEPMVAAFKLPQDVANFVDKYSRVTVFPVDAPDLTADGTVSFISPDIDEENHVIALKAEVSNPEQKIKGGQAAKVRIETRKVDSVLGILPGAILHEGDKAFVFVTHGNFVKKVEVQVGRNLADGTVEIIADIRVDDPIVINPPTDLGDEAFVRVAEKTVEE